MRNGTAWIICLSRAGWLTLERAAGSPPEAWCLCSRSFSCWWPGQFGMLMTVSMSQLSEIFKNQDRFSPLYVPAS